jgi:putative protease
MMSDGRADCHTQHIKKMASVELLSPAGSWNALKAAISEGADAVYFGVEGFNARRRAENFTTEELYKIVEYCHNRGVKAYLTANILVKNSEMGNYLSLLSKAYTAGADAIIIQDLAFIPLIKQNFPDLKVHISTQAGVFNWYFKDLIDVADRVIMPRELTLNEIKEFHDKTKIDVEVFAQGALCYSIGGQCLMSSFLGGRSGNRGLCAQPCRKKFNKKFAISTKDLNVIENLPEIVNSGVKSIKIEGRLRSAEYVGAATAVYRHALDSIKKGSYEIDSNALMDLQLAFSREYTKGMLFKESDIVTPDAAGKRGIKLGVMQEGQKIRLMAPILEGDGVGITGLHGTHGDMIRKIFYNGKPVEKAERGWIVKLPINAKTGDKIELTSGAQRRSRYKIPERKPIRIKREDRRIQIPEIKKEVNKKLKILVKTYCLEDAKNAINSGADRVYYNILSKDYPKGDKRISPYVPRCLPSWSAEKILAQIEEMKPESVLSGDLGVACNIKNSEVHLDISCNAFNDIDVEYYNSKGMTPVISTELSAKELNEFKDKRFAVYAHGRIPLMTTKYSLSEQNLKDEKNYVFPTRRESDYTQILNSVPYGLFEKTKELEKQGIRKFLLDLEENVGETIETYKKIFENQKTERPEGYTLGHFKKGVA